MYVGMCVLFRQNSGRISNKLGKSEGRENMITRRLHSQNKFL